MSLLDRSLVSGLRRRKIKHRERREYNSNPSARRKCSAAACHAVFVYTLPHGNRLGRTYTATKQCGKGQAPNLQLSVFRSCTCLYYVLSWQLLIGVSESVPKECFLERPSHTVQNIIVIGNIKHFVICVSRLVLYVSLLAPLCTVIASLRRILPQGQSLLEPRIKGGHGFAFSTTAPVLSFSVIPLCNNFNRRALRGQYMEIWLNVSKEEGKTNSEFWVRRMPNQASSTAASALCASCGPTSACRRPSVRHMPSWTSSSSEMFLLASLLRPG